jgi:DNA-directed RNA polymerase subunit omega
MDALRDETIVNRVGGRFKLTMLIQKRLVALNAGARPLVNLGSADKMETVIQEVLQDKIYLDMSGNVRVRGEAADAGGPPELDLANL